MSLTLKIWLNWEAFEVASIISLFTAEISMEKITLFANKFADRTAIVSNKEFIEKASQVFRLTPDQLDSIYNCLSAFFTKDPHEAIRQTHIAMTNPKNPVFSNLRCCDILCYLFAIYVKKKYRSVAEVSQCEQFPHKNEAERLSPHQKRYSASSPTVGARMSLRSTSNERTQYSLMFRFFISKLANFFHVLAPNGFTMYQVDSLSFLICVGDSFVRKSLSLSDIITEADYQNPERFYSLISSSLSESEKCDSSCNRADTPINSPLTYRPQLQLRNENQADAPPSPLFEDKPIVINGESNSFKVICPTNGPSVHIHNCKHMTIYICGIVSSVFIGQCKDSTVFLGASNSIIHLEFCANVRLYSASRFLHLDTCTRISSFILVNNRPLVTGNCNKLVFGPYSSIYSRLASNIASAGVNPYLNRWRDPLVLGSLSFSTFSIISPNDFALNHIPIKSTTDTPPVMPPLPEEYQNSLQEKMQSVLQLKQNLERIKQLDPALSKKIADGVKSKASRWIQDEGYMQEITAIFGLSQEQNFAQDSTYSQQNPSTPDSPRSGSAKEQKPQKIDHISKDY